MAIFENAYNRIGDVLMNHIKGKIEETGVDLQVKRYFDTSRQIRVLGEREVILSFIDQHIYVEHHFTNQVDIDAFENWVMQNQEKVDILNQLKGLGWLDVIFVTNWSTYVERLEVLGYALPYKENIFCEFGLVEFREN